MSLVITAWDQSVGIAISEGRIAAKIDGAYVPIEENYRKLTRLANGGVLGATGNYREEFPIVIPLCDVFEQRLHPAIVEAARLVNFCGLCEYIPTLLKTLSATYPGLIFCVSLLGIEDGTVRGGAWDSNGSVAVPIAGSAPSWQILGTKETSPEAHAAVRACLNRIGLQDPLRTSAAIQDIVRELARNHAEINDRTYAELISPTAAMTADMITSGVLNAALVDVTNIDASNIITGTLSATMVLFPDGTEISSASRVLTATASPSANTSLPSLGVDSIPGFGFTVSASGSSDVFNFFAWLQFDGNGEFTVELWLDGTNLITQTAQGSYIIPFVFSKTGLSAGSHTFQFWVGSPSGGTVNILSNSYCVCQRTY